LGSPFAHGDFGNLGRVDPETAAPESPAVVELMPVTAGGFATSRSGEHVNMEIQEHDDFGFSEFDR
jgi:hypothetical protein